MKHLISIKDLAGGDTFLYKGKTMILHKVQADRDRYIAVENSTEEMFRDMVYMQTWLKGDTKVEPIKEKILCS